MEFRYKVIRNSKDFGKGFKYGVYDIERGCYPFAGPELRAAGFARIDWFSNAKEAQAVADTLNGGVPRRIEAPLEAANEDDALVALADALVGGAR